MKMTTIGKIIIGMAILAFMYFFWPVVQKDAQCTEAHEQEMIKEVTLEDGTIVSLVNDACWCVVHKRLENCF